MERHHHGGLLCINSRSSECKLRHPPPRFNVKRREWCGLKLNDRSMNGNGTKTCYNPSWGGYNPSWGRANCGGKFGTPQPPGESLLDSLCIRRHSLILLSVSQSLVPLPYSPRQTGRWGGDGIPKGAQPQGLEWAQHSLVHSQVHART